MTAVKKLSLVWIHKITYTRQSVCCLDIVPLWIKSGIFFSCAGLRYKNSTLFGSSRLLVHVEVHAVVSALHAKRVLLYSS